MKTLILLVSFLSSVACGSLKQVTPSENTRTEVHTETVIVKDTILVNLPKIVMTKETLDTISIIDNRYARSAASMINGVLVHKLEIKPVEEPVVVDKQIVYRDSLVYVDRVERETVEVEKPLTGWQQVRQFLGGIVLIAIFIWIVLTIINYLLTKKVF